MSESIELKVVMNGNSNIGHAIRGVIKPLKK
jgi:hypothetical protein